MVGQSIDISRLNLEELLGVISIYPWYAGARKELCDRMSASGNLSQGQVSQTALYMYSRRLLSELVRAGRVNDYADAEVEKLLKGLMEPASPESAQPAPESETPTDMARRIFVVGGDYFSSQQYKEARHSDDNIFSGFASSEREDLVGELPEEEFDLCTETLAGIYAEQGYTEEAKQIYSTLSLRYPEKSVYFAALIEKLDKN